MVERRLFRRSRVRIPFYFFYYLFSFTRKEKSYERKNDTQEKLTKDPDDTRCDGNGIYGIRNGESHTKSTVTYPGTFRKEPARKGTNEMITSELIYYWMIAQGIPAEFERWHINRLLTLIRVCNAKNSPGKKMSSSAVTRRNEALNKARRAKYHSKG